MIKREEIKVGEHTLVIERDVCAVVHKTVEGRGHFLDSIYGGFANIDDQIIDICSLAGEEIEKLEEEYEEVFSRQVDEARDGDWHEDTKNEYFEATQREHPRAYRIKISIDIEEMCKEDAKQYWDDIASQAASPHDP